MSALKAITPKMNTPLLGKNVTSIPTSMAMNLITKFFISIKIAPFHHFENTRFF